MSSLLGVNPYKSKMKLWREKNGLEQEKEEFFGSYALERGVALEEDALRQALSSFPSLLEGKIALQVGLIYGPGEVGGPPMLACSPDLVLLGGDLEQPLISGIEAKVPLAHNIPKQVKELAPAHVVQVAMRLCCLDADEWYLFYYYPGGEEEKKGGEMYRFRPRHDRRLWDFFLNRTRVFLAMATEPKKTCALEKKNTMDSLHNLLEIKKIY